MKAEELRGRTLDECVQAALLLKNFGLQRRVKGQWLWAETVSTSITNEGCDAYTFVNRLGFRSVQMDASGESVLEATIRLVFLVNDKLDELAAEIEANTDA